MSPGDRPVLSHGWVLDVALRTLSPGRPRRHHTPASGVSVTGLVWPNAAARHQTDTDAHEAVCAPTCPDPRGPPRAAAVPALGTLLCPRTLVSLSPLYFSVPLELEQALTPNTIT